MMKYSDPMHSITIKSLKYSETAVRAQRHKKPFFIVEIIVVCILLANESLILIRGEEVLETLKNILV